MGDTFFQREWERNNFTRTLEASVLWKPSWSRSCHLESRKRTCQILGLRTYLPYFCSRRLSWLRRHFFLFHFNLHGFLLFFRSPCFLGRGTRHTAFRVLPLRDGWCRSGPSASVCRIDGRCDVRKGKEKSEGRRRGSPHHFKVTRWHTRVLRCPVD